MNDFIKWTIRTVLIGIFWVFVLSINVNDRPLFSYAHEVFVENAVVGYIDEQLGELWGRVEETARLTFSRDRLDEEQM